MENVKLYTFRYMWLFDNCENVCVKIICGTEKEHADFMNMLATDEKVVKACRVYVNEIDLSNIEHYEDIFELCKEKAEENA